MTWHFLLPAAEPALSQQSTKILPVTLSLHICASTTPPLENARGVKLRAFTPYAAAYCFSQQSNEIANCRTESPNIECSTINTPQGPKCLGDSSLAPSSSGHLIPLTLLQCSHSKKNPLFSIANHPSSDQIARQGTSGTSTTHKNQPTTLTNHSLDSSPKILPAKQALTL